MIERTLSYGEASLRVLVSAERVAFAATDLFALNSRRTDRALLAHFDPLHLSLETFASEAGPVRLTAVSPLGVATIAADMPFPLCRILDSWVRKTMRKLSEELGCPALEWTLLADGRLPIQPRSYDDRYGPWSDLKRRYPHGEPRPANLYEPCLFDEDPSLPRHDPDADLPAFNAIRAEAARNKAFDELRDRIRRQVEAERVASALALEQLRIRTLRDEAERRAAVPITGVRTSLSEQPCSGGLAPLHLSEL